MLPKAASGDIVRCLRAAQVLTSQEDVLALHVSVDDVGMVQVGQTCSQYSQKAFVLTD